MLYKRANDNEFEQYHLELLNNKTPKIQKQIRRIIVKKYFILSYSYIELYFKKLYFMKQTSIFFKPTKMHKMYFI